MIFASISGFRYVWKPITRLSFKNARLSSKWGSNDINNILFFGVVCSFCDASHWLDDSQVVTTQNHSDLILFFNFMSWNVAKTTFDSRKEKTIAKLAVGVISNISVCVLWWHKSKCWTKSEKVRSTALSGKYRMILRRQKRSTLCNNHRKRFIVVLGKKTNDCNNFTIVGINKYCLFLHPRLTLFIQWSVGLSVRWSRSHIIAVFSTRFSTGQKRNRALNWFGIESNDWKWTYDYC